MKSAARFMISWFGMAMVERKIVLQQWIIYENTTVEINNKRYM